MGTKIQRGFGVFVLSAALAVSEASAQTTGVPPDLHSKQPGTVSNPPPEAGPNQGPTMVSVDLLRHPLSAKVRQRLARAMERMDSGDYDIAIEQLLETLKKFPDSAPYVQGLLGVAYVKTDRFEAAVGSFEQAVAALSHDAMAHYNFGLALVCAGNYTRAAQEIQRALELDPQNPRIQARLNALLEQER